MIAGSWSLSQARASFLPLPRYSLDTLADVQARFGIISGDVGLLAQGAKEWIAPHEGLPIEPGDEIRTGEDGRVELIMSDNALWLPSPKVTSKPNTSTPTPSTPQFIVGNLDGGEVDSERAASTVQRWEFNTPAAVIAIRGTEFAIEFSKKNGARLGVFEGTVGLAPAETAEGQQPPIDVDAGHEAIVKRGRPIQTTTKFSPSMKVIAAALPAFRRRLREVQHTWSPFTPDVRAEARKRFVAPPPKPIHHRPPVRKSPTASANS